MKTTNGIQPLDEVIQAKSAPAEYWELISSEMNVLYLLAFLLTADKGKAEQCLDATLNDFVEGFGDFVDWARTRGREAVLKHAIGMLKPDPEATGDEMDLRDGLDRPTSTHIFGAIASLPTFERFVFVITTIYGQSDTECATHLATTRCDVGIAREIAGQILAIDNGDGPVQYSKPTARFGDGYLFNPRCSTC